MREDVAQEAGERRLAARRCPADPHGYCLAASLRRHLGGFRDDELLISVTRIELRIITSEKKSLRRCCADMCGRERDHTGSGYKNKKSGPGSSDITNTAAGRPTSQAFRNLTTHLISQRSCLDVTRD